MLIALLSLLGGFLSVLAPCILPLLPIIIGGGLTGQQNRKRPYIITASLVVSLVLFTILLKISTALIGIDPNVWSYLSGGIIILLGLTMLFPHYWDIVIGKLGIQAKSQQLLGQAGHKNGLLQPILTGAALGPVFSSCSPMYAWVIATVLPENTLKGTVYLGFYCLGLSIALLLIALMGRKITSKLGKLTNPTGWFQRGIAIVFVLVGLAVVTGFQKSVQTYLVDKDFLNLKSLEEKLIPEEDDSKYQKASPTQESSIKSSVLNVASYRAPEFVGLTDWINSEPLNLSSLRGKVVLVDFWTYSCINCIRSLPYIQKWHETYQDDGFVLIGVHAPEFAFEKVPKNVQDSVTERGLTYPIALDNGFETWSAYENRYWPAHYLIDKDGNVRREHFGEGEYDETETAIRLLLAEGSVMPADDMTIKENIVVPVSSNQTPETYLGYERAERQVAYTSMLNQNEWAIDQTAWSQDSESITSLVSSALKMNFTAKKVYLVMGSVDGSPKEVQIFLGDVAQKPVTVTSSTLYTVLDLKQLKSGDLRLQIPAGVTLNAFTFES